MTIGNEKGWSSLRVSSPEGYSCIPDFCPIQHERQGFICSVGQCAMEESVAALVTAASEAEPVAAPSRERIQELMQASKAQLR